MEGLLQLQMQRCDGCDLSNMLVEVRADGHFARYCRECKTIYDGWVVVCQGEENRLNRLLDLFIETSRQHVALAFVPQDLPRTGYVRTISNGHSDPVVLG